MKILVCISIVPDTTAKISFTDDNTKFNTQGVSFIMNPTDEWYALVKGVEIKEQAGGSVTIITVGGKDTEKDMRKALAIGADNAVRVNADPTDAYFVASQIAAYAKAENFDIVLTGKETIDYNGFNVGGMLSELLDMPYISLVNHLELAGNTATLSREIEGGVEKLKVNTPFVVSSQKGMAEQRIPNMRGIMMARRKPLKVIEPAAVEAFTEISNYELPPQRAAVKLVDPENPAELVRLLNEEAKAI